MADGFTDPAHEKRLKFRALLQRPGAHGDAGRVQPALCAPGAGGRVRDASSCAGSQLSHFLYGVPDNGIIGLRDLVDHARHMAAHSDIPILVDADTGYGNAVNVYFAVQEIIRSGVAAMQIEDQEAPKKSGTVAGPALHPGRRGGRQDQGGGRGARRDRSEFRHLRALRRARRRGQQFRRRAEALHRLRRGGRRRSRLAQFGRDARAGEAAPAGDPGAGAGDLGRQGRAADRRGI